MSYFTMAVAAKQRNEKIVSDALDGKYPPDGEYETDDCHLVVSGNGTVVFFAHKYAVSVAALEAFLGDSDLVLV